MSETFCVLPWLHLASHPPGTVSLCCMSEHDKGESHARNFRRPVPDYMNLGVHTLDGIMNCDYFVQARRQMLAGVEVKGCMRCYQDEAKGLKSKRQIENENYPDFTVEKARAITPRTGLIDVQLRYVELRMGNICNVKCRSCNPISSSKWGADYRKLRKELDWLPDFSNMQTFDWPERAEFWDDLLAHSNLLEVLYINGGEPTLIKKHWEYLERLHTMGRAKDITLIYNINMTTLPDDAFRIWRAFKKVRIMCSIDDLGSRNALLRSGTDWAKVEAHLDCLQAHPWVSIEISQTLSWLNVFYAGEFVEYMTKRGIEVLPNVVNEPRFLAPWILPEPVKQAVIERSASRMSPEMLDMYRAFLSRPSNPAMMAKGIEYNNALDRIRSEKWGDVFSELSDLLRTYHE